MKILKFNCTHILYNEKNLTFLLFKEKKKQYKYLTKKIQKRNVNTFYY